MPAQPTAEALQIIAEEEALLERVQQTLALQPRAKPSDRPALAQTLRGLQEEAAGASARDLPSLFQQMTSVRALLEREQVDTAVDADVPYFAHLRLRTRKGPRDYLLGRATFADTQAGVRIVDWRYAPIARIYYGYEEGDPFEETLPGGVLEGVVEARRVLVIERGRLNRILAGDVALVRRDDGWVQLAAGATLGGGSGTAARPGVLGVGAEATNRSTRLDITALLDPEQFEAVHASADRSLLVLGSAGSGKTTVALHRLSRLAFDDPQRFPPHRLQVVVPEQGLARLSRKLLEPLGLSSVKVSTLDDWLHHTALETFEQRSIAVTDEAPASVSRLKRHPALREPLVRALPRDAGRMSFHVLRRKVQELFADRAFVARVVEDSQGDLPIGVIDDAARHTMLQLAQPLGRAYEGYDEQALRTLDGRAIDADTPDALAGTVDPEDLALMLYVRGLTAPVGTQALSHLLLDEAEDFSVFDLGVLGQQLEDEGACTLAGDEMQQTTSSFPGWPALLEIVGAQNAVTCRLQVSYRCPKPITELAQQILGTQAPVDAAKSGREGAPVGMHVFPDEAQGQLFLADALRHLLDRERDASVGIIASTPEAARRIYQVLEEVPEARLVLDGEFSFAPGIDVTDVDNVKGLEFDYVILPDVTPGAYPDTPESRRRLHVAVTRASHQLWVMAAGRLSSIVAERGVEAVS